MEYVGFISFLKLEAALAQYFFLYGDRNQIVSIESMQQMCMPHLIKISLSYNNLTGVKPLRRLYLPKLDQIQLGNVF